MLFICVAFINAQSSFSDDFESYSVGDKVGTVSSEWTTWSGATGGNEDATVTDNQASSGSNSIYFGSTSANGGPQDVVLPFGGKLESGLFTFSIKVYVDNGGGAYYNFQGEETIGQVWTHNAYFLESGELNFGSSEGIVLRTRYEVETWVTVDYEINLTENSWKISVDGECLGSFANAANSVASIDIFPTQGHSFYVDDISYSYEPNAEPKLLDGTLNITSAPYAGFTGMTEIISGSITNTGANMISDATLNVNFPDGPREYSFDNLNLAKGESHEFDIADTYMIAEGTNALEIELTKVNELADEEKCNNLYTGQVLGVTPAEGKNIIVEEGTGTWCGFCPRGAVFLERLTEKYGDRFVGIAVHNGDPMVVSGYDGQHGFSGYPGATVMRRSANTGFGIMQDLELPFLNYIAEGPMATFHVGAQLDIITGDLSFSAEINANRTINNTSRLAIVIVEDGVTGTAAQYAQSNYYANNVLGEMGGYESLPETIPASQMVYDHVARAIPLGYGGSGTYFDDEIAKDDSKVLNFTYKIPASYDSENLHIVMMMINSDGSINNGYSIKLEDAIANGFTSSNNELITEVTDISAFPNPTNNLLNLDLESNETMNVSVEIVNILSQRVYSDALKINSGTNKFRFDVSQFVSGTYYVVFKSENSTRSIKFIKE